MTSTVFFVRYSFLVCIALLLFSGCNDQPSPIGSDFITDTLTTVVISSDTTSLLDSSYSGQVKVALTNGGDRGNVAIFLVGQTSDIKSTTFVRFGTVHDSIANLTEQEIVSAALKLLPLDYAYGDTQSNALSFRVHRIKNLWGPSATTDTLLAGDFFGEQFGSFSGNIPYSDTIPPVMIPFTNTGDLHRWLFTDSAKYGLALVPDAGSSLVRRFATIDAAQADQQVTSIELVYKRTGSDHNDTVLVPAAFINTFVESLIPLRQDRMTVQGGVVYRTHLFFDVSMIPALAVIHRAELVLTLDPSASKNGTVDEEPDLIARFAVDSTLTTSDGSFATGVRQIGTDNYTFPNIAPAVERWLRTGTNYGLILHSESARELPELNNMVFYGLNDPDPSKRPRLVIVYSVPAKLK